MSNEALEGRQVSFQQIRVEDYFAIIKRRKLAFTIPFLLAMAIAILLAFYLPSIYRSEVTILIERQEIPTDLVETTVTGYVQERIEGLNKRILTYRNLWDIAKKLDLYRGDGSPEDIESYLEHMFESIEVAMEDVRTGGPEQARQGLATIAFTVAYETAYPEEALKVVEELSSLYIQENQRLRSEHAEEVSEFLNSEAARLSAEITELEKKLAAFKQEQSTQLPELRDLNHQLYEKTASDIERTKEQIQLYDNRITALSAELAITKQHQDVFDDSGNKVMTGSERLSSLTAEYLRLSARYSSKHPDVVKLRREIESLGGESNAAGVTALINKLTILKDKLVVAKQKYSEDHPDVIRLRNSIAAVERGLQTASVSRSKTSSLTTAPDNPTYVSLKTQLDTAASNLQSERQKLIQLSEKLEEYETRLFKTPMVEKDYNLLTRDYENAKQKYNEIKDKQIEARLAVQLESSSKGERFSIVQPATLPLSPVRPNRLGIGLLGFLIACGFGVGAMTIREYLDKTIYNSRDLMQVFRAPPLVAIPNFRN